ncbi:hypothetical protein C8R47DRAFT_1228995 [Mycena vitilis]|nr:hypothetical protein C8R47DRAFT_1228995 [Mycena vitilis]
MFSSVYFCLISFFEVIIPPLKKTTFLTTSKEILHFQASGGNEGLLFLHISFISKVGQDEDEDDVQMGVTPLTPPKIPEHLSLLLPLDGSSSGLSSSPSGSSSSPSGSSSSGPDPFSTPSSSLSSNFTSSPSPMKIFPMKIPVEKATTSTGVHPRLALPDDEPNPIVPGQIRPIYNSRVADARAYSDAPLMKALYGNTCGGLYFYNFEAHPLSSPTTPHVLLPYDMNFNPLCVPRVMNNLDFINTAISCVIRELNSTIGVPESDFVWLIVNSTFWGCCNELLHQVLWISLLIQCHAGDPFVDVPRIKGRTFPNGYKLPHTEEFLEAPVGMAFLEWNSRFGVALDVWAMIKTGCVYCRMCKLRRSPAGHAAHLDGLDDCKDVGQGDGVILIEQNAEDA